MGSSDTGETTKSSIVRRRLIRGTKKPVRKTNQCCYACGESGGLRRTRSSDQGQGFYVTSVTIRDKETRAESHTIFDNEKMMDTDTLSTLHPLATSTTCFCVPRVSLQLALLVRC